MHYSCVIHALVQWMACTAKNDTATSSGVAAGPDGWDCVAADPDGWDCEVEKRCVCLRCTMGSSTDKVGLAALSDGRCTGTSRSLVIHTTQGSLAAATLHAPESVQAKAGLQCAQT